MNRKLMRLLSIILTAAILLGLMPIAAAADSTVYYIKNSYTPGACLYEAEGVLRYGIPTAGDKHFQWIIEDRGSSKTIQNAATGHYITLEGHGDASVEGNWGEAVACIPWQEGKDTFLWSSSIGQKQNILSASQGYEGFALHLEHVTNGQVAGQQLESDQLQWGNMQWDILKEADIDFTAMSQGGFCIQNAESGAYLRTDKGILTYGNPDGADDAYIWIIEVQKDGRKAIKNKKTGQYISMTDYNKAAFTLGCNALTAGDDKSLWDFQLAPQTAILSASTGYADYGLYVEKSSNGKARCGEIKGREDFPTPDMKWSFIPAGNVEAVAGSLILEDGIYHLKNSYYSMYLIEEDGAAVYGNVKRSDKNAQWRILYDQESGKTAIRNEASGHYLYMSKDSRLVCDSNEVYYWNLKRNKNDDYPKAVIFQDAAKTDSYLHMESLNGFIENSNAVQPTWGTPHWEPIKVEAAAQADAAPKAASLAVPKSYINLLSSAKNGGILYENASGALVHGEYKAEDANAQWELVESKTKGAYYLKNRGTSHVVVNKGNGTLRCVPEAEAVLEGSLWQIAEGSAPNSLLFNNNYAKLKPYQQPYLNIQKLKGSAQSSLVSIEAETTQWIWVEAQEAVAAIEEKTETFVPMKAYMDTNLYRLLYQGEYLKSEYKLEYLGDKTRIIDAANGRYLYFKNGWKTKSLRNQGDLSVQWSTEIRQGITALKNGEAGLVLEKMPSDAIYAADQAHVMGARRIFTVFVKEAGTYKVEVGYSSASTSTDFAVNGIKQESISLPLKEELNIALKKGINTIAITNNPGLSNITIVNSVHKAYRGASASYVEYQAEDCNIKGSLLEESRAYREIASEASGRMAVRLEGTGEYLKLTLTEPANAMVVRYCIPDSKDGTGLDETLNMYIDGVKSRSIELTSRYSWVYGKYPWSNNPADGQAHHFFDEASILLDKTYPAGTVIKLQKDAANHAEYYILDLIEMEEISEAARKPQNTLSIEQFGAIGNDGRDDTKALYECIEAAVPQGKEVWIPEGVFELNSPTAAYDAGDGQNKNRGIVIQEDNVVIRGAGMWHSVLKGAYAAFFVKANNVAFYDFSLRGAAVSRRDVIDPSAIEADYNTPEMRNLTVQNVWIEHYKTGIWTHNMKGLHVIGCRIRNTFADGMNLRRGTSDAVVEQCDVRNTGDDAIALWSSEYSDVNNRVCFNTVSLQWLANNIAIYGGTDIKVTDNILRDTVAFGSGVNISTNFNPKPFAGTISVARNTLERCGGHDYNNNQDHGAIWFNTVAGNDNHAEVLIQDNLVLNSTYQGISFENKGTVDHVLLEGNVVEDSGSYGIDITAGSRGAAAARNNLVHRSMLEDIHHAATDSLAFTTEITSAAAGKEYGGKIFLMLALLLAAVLLAGLKFIYIPYRRKHMK